MATRDQPAANNNRMKLLLAIFLLLALVGVGSAQTNVPPFPTNPTVGDQVVGPDGQIYTWDGTKWAHGVGPPAGPFAPQVNPAGGVNNYAPLAAPNFTGVVSIGGVPLTGLFAPLTNPANGQNNYAPLASPTFTGTVTMPNALLSNTASSSIYWGSSTVPQAAIGGIAPNFLVLTAGAHYDGTNYIADTTEPAVASLTATGFNVFVDPGQTVGSAYTPTNYVAQIGPNAAQINNPVLNVRLISGTAVQINSVNGCTTGGAVGDFCQNTLTMSPAMSDVNYNVFCDCAGAVTGRPVMGNYVQTSNTQYIVNTFAITAEASSCTNVICLAVHP